jgi:NADH:ubiquinone oxidoreductase subunit 5 (subunit L)/multisubunit Na+/H+ antiporter MnhA subunit
MKSRFYLKYSLSVNELKKLQKKMKSRERKYIKGYAFLSNLLISLLVLSGLSVFFLILNAIKIYLNNDIVSDELQRLKDLNLYILIIFASLLIMLGLFSSLDEYLTKRNEKREIEGIGHNFELRINRKFIEQRYENISHKTYWSAVIDTFIYKKYIFIDLEEHNYIIIPMRAVGAMEEFNQLFEFIKERSGK